VKRAGYLVATNSPSSEEQAGWQFVQTTKLRALQIPLIHSSITPSLLQAHSLLWWHYDSSTQLPSEATDPRVITAMRQYLENGGSLLLTLPAAQYVIDLGIEKEPPSVIAKGIWGEQCWAKDYPDIRGMAGFQGHPIFADLGGAAYTWCPKPGDDYSCAIYEEPRLPTQGKIVAVERQYIRLNEDRRVVVEYQVGKGRVLTVGMHMYFAQQKNRFRPHLEKLAGNCLEYLASQVTASSTRAKSKLRADGIPGSARTYWNFDLRTVRQTSYTSPRLRISKPAPKVAESGLRIERRSATENFFDVGGRRLLMMGTERNGIEEVWVHPVRILRNLRAKFTIGETNISSSREFDLKITVRPESVTREFTRDDTRIIETIFSDVNVPAGGITYDTRTEHNTEILISGEIDLRMMWPLSEKATGPLEYWWDEGLRAFFVNSVSTGLAAIIGISAKPQEIVCSLNLDKDVMVTFGMRIRLTRADKQCTLCFAGSNQGLPEAERAYRKFMSDPRGVLNRQANHFRKLLRKTKPQRDPEINEALRWAVVGLDRFMAETPGVGTSLMAGFATTKAGWNGRHAVSGRPGYAWYFGRDSLWCCLALLATGQVKHVRSVLDFLGQRQDITGKILHECTTSGFIHYDAADSTPLYVFVMGQYLRSSRDRRFIKKEFPRLLKAIEFCFSTDTDGDHLIENANVGHGWVEGGPLFPVHAELYLNSCWAAALKEAAYVAGSLGKRKESRAWETEGRAVKRIINKEFWNPKTRFYNFAKNEDGSFNTEKTIMPAVTILLGLADHGKGKRCVRAFGSPEFSAEWGVRMLGRGSSLYDPSGYHSGTIWPLFTGWAAMAASALGMRKEQAHHMSQLVHLHRLFSAGHVPEVLDGERRKQSGVCPHQAWSDAMVVLGLVNQGEVRRRISSSSE